MGDFGIAAFTAFLRDRRIRLPENAIAYGFSSEQAGTLILQKPESEDVFRRFSGLISREHPCVWFLHLEKSGRRKTDGLHRRDNADAVHVYCVEAGAAFTRKNLAPAKHPIGTVIAVDAFTQQALDAVIASGPAAAVRSPPWTRDELILALELYFRHRPDTISKAHPEVLKLSVLLNDLPIHAVAGAENYRNENSVYMKLCNFLRFDAEYDGKGLPAGGKLEAEVWDEFSTDRQRLRDVAAAIVAAASDPEIDAAAAKDDDDDEGFPEGRLLLRLHRARERSPKLREAAKKRAMQVHGRLFCVVCNFDFARTYGAAGEGFIECHHTKAVSELTPGTKTRLEDVALLCANCHRIVHRRRPWLTLATLAELLVRPA